MQPVVRGSHPLVWRDTSRKLPLLPEKAVPDPHMRELTIGSTKHHYRPSADCVYLHRASTITSTLCTGCTESFLASILHIPSLKDPLSSAPFRFHCIQASTSISCPDERMLVTGICSGPRPLRNCLQMINTSPLSPSSIPITSPRYCDNVESSELERLRGLIVLLASFNRTR